LDNKIKQNNKYNGFGRVGLLDEMGGRENDYV
jgi:hypothetical protein